MFLLYLVLLAGQTNLPDTPKPKQVVILESKPFAINLSSVNKYNISKQQFTAYPSIGIDWRFYKHLLRLGISYSLDPKTRESTVSGTLNLKILEFGHR